MLMIPLPFVIALFALAYLVVEVATRGTERRNGWLLAFLSVLIFQEVLIGLRFGYDWAGLRQIQPLSAALIPPLGYLSFQRPAFTTASLLHGVTFVAVCLSLGFWIGGLDSILALSNLIYAGLLIRLGLAGSDALAWVAVGRSRAVLLLLWLVVALLLISCLTDAAIALDYWTTQGDNTGRIAGWTTIIGLVGAGIALIVVTLRGRAQRSGQGVVDTPQDKDVFAALESLMAAGALYLDPDINLNRIARRMVLPARDVSHAINTVAGCNVSQYVNRLRVAHACTLLKGQEMSVTQILYASGFNTKSNFNREFARITGQSPSAWRADNLG